MVYRKQDTFSKDNNTNAYQMPLGVKDKYSIHTNGRKSHSQHRWSPTKLKRHNPLSKLAKFVCFKFLDASFKSSNLKYNKRKSKRNSTEHPIEEDKDNSTKAQSNKVHKYKF